MKTHRGAALMAVMVLACSATGRAKKPNERVERKTYDAPPESVYVAAVKVAGHEWHVVSTDEATHTVSFETTNTPLETSGGYSTYTVAVRCAAAPGGGTAVSLQVTEHGSSQPSLMALMNKSERQKRVIEDYWDGLESELKESALPSGAALPPSPQPGTAQPPPPPNAVLPPRPAGPAGPAEPAPAPPAQPRTRSVAPPASRKPPDSGELAAITINSTPAGADITVQGKFFGDTPTTARLPAGDYAISIEKAGYKPWKRTVTLTARGTVTLDATLESSQ